mmetsp:Transcript_70919/g.178810  ORF Transcript_70919/g.178810 Transcript_70919/m.178810 type:complete len:251 (-) Transcript_70919:12-764(-)
MPRQSATSTSSRACATGLARTWARWSRGTRSPTAEESRIGASSSAAARTAPPSAALAWLPASMAARWGLASATPQRPRCLPRHRICAPRTARKALPAPKSATPSSTVPMGRPSLSRQRLRTAPRRAVAPLASRPASSGCRSRRVSSRCLLSRCVTRAATTRRPGSCLMGSRSAVQGTRSLQSASSSSGRTTRCIARAPSEECLPRRQAPAAPVLFWAVLPPGEGAREVKPVSGARQVRQAVRQVRQASGR